MLEEEPLHQQGMTGMGSLDAANSAAPTATDQPVEGTGEGGAAEQTLVQEEDGFSALSAKGVPALRAENLGPAKGEYLLTRAEAWAVRQALPMGVYICLIDDAHTTVVRSHQKKQPAPTPVQRPQTRSSEGRIRGAGDASEAATPEAQEKKAKRQSGKSNGAAKVETKPPKGKAKAKAMSARGRGKGKGRGRGRAAKAKEGNDSAADDHAEAEASPNGADDPQEAPEGEEAAAAAKEQGAKRSAKKRAAQPKVAPKAKAKKPRQERNPPKRKANNDEVNSSHVKREPGSEDKRRHMPEAMKPTAESSRRTAQLLTAEERRTLQGKLDQLSDDQLDRVFEFLMPELGGTANNQEVSLDLEMLPPERQHELVRIVDEELQSQAAAEPAPADAAAANPLQSPLFPSMEPGATPLAAATPLVAEATPRSDPVNAKKALAWEVCSAREVQRQSQLREVRESVGGNTPGQTPPGGVASAGEAAAAMPELMLPPAATGPPPVPSQQATAAPAPTATAAPPDRAGTAQGTPGAAGEASAPAPAAGAASGVAGSGDSMLERTDEVLNMVDFGWL